MERVFHPYTAWEEFKHGMWRQVTAQERRAFLDEAVMFTGNAPLYGSYMRRVIDEWPLSCEHNLTNTDMNRLAWVGHAACCLAIRCPEDITRAAWARLSQRQQDEANAQAQAAVDTWEARYCEKQNPQLHLFVA